MASSPGFHNARSPFASAAPLAHRPLSAIAATLAGGVPQHRVERVLAELLPGLDTLHGEGRICGDISVHSVGLDELGQAHLIALDSPRIQGERRLTFTSGYAPFELFTESPDWPRGPWTDIYGLSAVAYSLVAGQCPPPAEERVIDDDYQPLTSLGLDRYSQDFLHAIDRGLALRPGDRPQSIQAYAESLALPLFTQRAGAGGATMDTSAATSGTVVVAPSVHRNVWRALAFFGLLLLGTVAVASYWWGRLGAGAESVITHSQRVDPGGSPGNQPAVSGASTPLTAAVAPSAITGEAPLDNDAVAATEASSPSPALADASDANVVASLEAPSERAEQPAAKAERKVPPLVKVSINVRPWGEIFIDGVSRGVTPPLKTVMLRPGTHTVAIHNNAQPPFHTTLVVKPGTPAVITHTFR